jgi:hypothetical protein
MGRNLRNTAVAVLAACAIASAADARVRLVGSTPVAGSVVKAGMNSLRFNFSEPIALTLSGAVVVSSAGDIMNTGKAGLSSNSVRQLIVPVNGQVGAGSYTVSWHAVGGDGVRVDGSFNFDVKP